MKKLVALTIILAIVVVATVVSLRYQENPQQQAIYDAQWEERLTVPSDSEFDEYIYTDEYEEQYLDYRAYFERYGTVQVTVDRARGRVVLEIDKPNGETAYIIQHQKDGQAEPYGGGLRFKVSDRTFIAESPKEPDGYLIADQKAPGFALTEDRFSALVDFVKSDQPYGAERCPFAGRDIPHREEIKIIESKSVSTIKIDHYD
ncbi:hypothetical protein IJH33_01325 [Candidatus Saccharibacteria bacterium]|nr:hypothetical protein [Candidatus Saccharibacteria bacterium]